ncbi:MAG: vWA domain-containing protein [Bacillota bacterium]|nr:vWA domain-containing protein [Bacillota bacterium]
MRRTLPLLLLFLCVCLLAGSVAAAADTSLLSAEIGISSTDPELCERTLAGHVDLAWPPERQYFDVVFIQDASGSFTETMPQVKESLNQMLATLDLGTSDAGYPKDRAMLVTYQGSHGFGITDRDESFRYQDYSSWFGYQITSTPLTSDLTVLEAAVAAIQPKGATPTIDGLVRAQTEYRDALAADRPYDAKQYLENDTRAHRQTIYYLITDGVANSGYYANFPEGTKPVDFVPSGAADRAWTWVYEEQAYEYFKRYWEDDFEPPVGVVDSEYEYQHEGETIKYRTFVDESDKRLYLRDPDRQGSGMYERFQMYEEKAGGLIDECSICYEPWEHYALMMQSLEAKAGELKLTGGVPDSAGGAPGDALFISAYWEDIRRFVPGHLRGATYRPHVRPVVTAAMRNMASSGEYYISHNEGADFGEFQANLLAAFKRAVMECSGGVQIQLDPEVSFNPATIRLSRLVDEAWQPVGSGYDTLLSEDLGTLDLTFRSLPRGRYRIDYELLEDSYRQFEYRPVIAVKAATIGSDPTQLTGDALGTVSGNDNTDCLLTPTDSSETTTAETTTAESATGSETTTTETESDVTTQSETESEVTTQSETDTPTDTTEPETSAETSTVPETVLSETPTTQPTTEPDTSMPRTGRDDASPLIALFLLGGAAILILAVILRRKRRQGRGREQA